MRPLLGEIPGSTSRGSLDQQVAEAWADGKASAVSPWHPCSSRPPHPAATVPVGDKPGHLWKARAEICLLQPLAITPTPLPLRVRDAKGTPPSCAIIRHLLGPGLSPCRKTGGWRLGKSRGSGGGSSGRSWDGPQGNARERLTVTEDLALVRRAQSLLLPGCTSLAPGDLLHLCDPQSHPWVTDKHLLEGQSL